MLITAELSSLGQKAAFVGYLNSWNLPLGSIVRINSGSTTLRPAIEWQAEMTANPAAMNPPITVGLAKIDGLRVDLESDAAATARGMGVDLKNVILKNTVLVIGNPAIRSFFAAEISINSDPGIIERVRKAPETQFAVISAAIDGDDLRLFETYSPIPYNTIHLGNSYIHVSYSCRTIDVLQSRASRSESVIPVVVSLTRIRYDEATSRIRLDPRPAQILQAN